MVLTFSLNGLARACVDSSKFEMACEVDGVQRAVGLSLECFDVAVEIDYEVIPYSLFEVLGVCFDEKRFDLSFVSGRG